MPELLFLQVRHHNIKGVRAPPFAHTTFSSQPVRLPFGFGSFEQLDISSALFLIRAQLQTVLPAVLVEPIYRAAEPRNESAPRLQALRRCLLPAPPLVLSADGGVVALETTASSSIKRLATQT